MIRDPMDYIFYGDDDQHERMYSLCPNGSFTFSDAIGEPFRFDEEVFDDAYGMDSYMCMLKERGLINGFDRGNGKYFDITMSFAQVWMSWKIRVLS